MSPTSKFVGLYIVISFIAKCLGLQAAGSSKAAVIAAHECSVFIAPRFDLGLLLAARILGLHIT
jgi:hypothetical protein